MEKRLSLSVLLLLIVLISASITSYAYFTASFNKTDSSIYEVGSVIYPTIILEMGGDFSLNVKHSDMAASFIDTTKPVVTYTNEFPVSTGFTISESGGIANMVYNIYYEPTSIYYRSEENMFNDKEFVVSIDTVKGEKLVDEYNLNDVSDKILLYTGELSATGKHTKINEEFDITIGYYNQNFDQKDNADKSFGGNIIIEVEELTYSLE